MEIIKQGNKPKFYDFKCKFCGCIFRIDAHEAQIFNIFNDYQSTYEPMYCPDCHGYLDYDYRDIYKEEKKMGGKEDGR